MCAPHTYPLPSLPILALSESETIITMCLFVTWSILKRWSCKHFHSFHNGYLWLTGFNDGTRWQVFRPSKEVLFMLGWLYPVAYTRKTLILPSRPVGWQKEGAYSKGNHHRGWGKGSHSYLTLSNQRTEQGGLAFTSECVVLILSAGTFSVSRAFFVRWVSQLVK